MHLPLPLRGSVCCRQVNVDVAIVGAGPGGIDTRRRCSRGAASPSRSSIATRSLATNSAASFSPTTRSRSSTRSDVDLDPARRRSRTAASSAAVARTSSTSRILRAACRACSSMTRCIAARSTAARTRSPHGHRRVARQRHVRRRHRSRARRRRRVGTLGAIRSAARARLRPRPLASQLRIQAALPRRRQRRASSSSTPSAAATSA